MAVCTARTPSSLTRPAWYAAMRSGTHTIVTLSVTSRPMMPVRSAASPMKSFGATVGSTDAAVASCVVSTREGIGASHRNALDERAAGFFLSYLHEFGFAVDDFNHIPA